jgi:hypothetical protein
MAIATNPVRVELLPGEDPRVYDAITGEDLTHRCLRLELLPHREGLATLLLHRDGKPYLVRIGGDDAPATESRAIAAVSGTWENRGGARPPEEMTT